MCYIYKQNSKIIKRYKLSLFILFLKIEMDNSLIQKHKSNFTEQQSVWTLQSIFDKAIILSPPKNG